VGWVELLAGAEGEYPIHCINRVDLRRLVTAGDPPKAGCREPGHDHCAAAGCDGAAERVEKRVNVEHRERD